VIQDVNPLKNREHSVFRTCTYIHKNVTRFRGIVNRRGKQPVDIEERRKGGKVRFVWMSLLMIL
jgi:hypothetical protein